ncbi:MAG: cation:proton antiporter [Candidatus Woesearchaeota archaeon]
MLVDIAQLGYLAIILIFGFLVLYLRRKAQGSKSLYRLVLILAGVVLYLFFGEKIDMFITRNLASVLLITLAFELSMRMHTENIKGKRSAKMFLLLLLMNMLIGSILSAILLNVNILHAIVFSIIITSIEYFLVDELREEGDVANPLILLFSFSLMYFAGLKTGTYVSTASLVQYVLIGVGMGVFAAIILLKLLKSNKITWFYELTLLCSAYIIYMLTEYLGGFGLLSVMIIGGLFANSYIRKKSEMNTFSPFIFKTLEILIFVLIGFIITLSIDVTLLWKSLILFFVYAMIRFLVISMFHRRYSIQNKLLLTLAPKGMVFAVAMLVLVSQNMILQDLAISMLYILIYSLIFSWIMEAIEERKIQRIERVYNVLKHIRYGRKKFKKHI